MKGIPYEMVYTSKFGPKGKIPYIHLVTETKNEGGDKGGSIDEKQVEVIPDSNVIITRLEEEFGTKEDFLSNKEKAMGHAITRMLDEHTAPIGFYYRYTLHMQDFMQVLQIPTNLFSADVSRKGAFIAKMFAKFMPKGYMKKMKMRGLAEHSDQELWTFSNDDLKAISIYLDDNKYFFGGDHATAIDCVIFAHLSQFVYIPLSKPFPQLAFIKEECPNLLLFMERFKSQYWPDWETKCQRQLNQQCVGDNNNGKTSGRRRITSMSKFCSSALLVTGFAILVQRYLL